MTLAGTADAAYWRERLARESLAPVEIGGRAQMLVVAADAKFRGIRFQELSVTVLLEPAGAFLVQAFNSRRFFAWSERVFFRTPYEHAEVSVSATRIAAASFVAERRGSRAPLPPADRDWRGDVHLPRGKMFYAELTGAAERFPFTAEDVFEPGNVSALRDADFAPEEWIVRADARHAKSRTFDARPPLR